MAEDKSFDDLLIEADAESVIKFPDLPNTHCCICGQEIKMLAFMNTGVCCENHRKDRDNDHGPARVGYISGS